METQLMIAFKNYKTVTKIIFASDTHRRKKQNQVSLFPLDNVEHSIIKQGKSSGSIL